jgi:hypothetical protein
MDVYRAGELRADSEGHAGAMAGNMRDIKQGIKGFFTGKESVEEEFNPTDSVSMDVPLMIRIMEYAREDAKTDMALHDVAENLIRLSNEGRTLTMADYDAIVGSVEQDRPVGEELGEEVDPALANKIRQLYQQIYNQGDDALEYLNTNAPLFSQFWDQYEGDLDSIISELSPKNLIRIAQELQQVAGQEGVEEGFTKTPSGDYINQHTGVRSSKPPIKKKRSEKTGAEWDAIEKAKKDKEQGVAEGWDPDTTRLEQDVRDALENGDDYTAKQYAKMAPTPEAKKYLLNIIKQAMYIDDLGGETDWKGVAEGMEAQLPQDTLDLIDEYIAKIEPTADRNKMIQDVVDGYIHTSELEYALQEGVAEGLGKLSHEQKVKMIQDLEIQISKLEQQQGGQYGNLFPQKLKLVRKLQKLRDSLGKQGVAEESGQPTMRRVTHEKPSGNGEMVKVVTYEVLNSKGVTVKTGMSRETAASLLKHLKQQGK